jgi:hypothetical protein
VGLPFHTANVDTDRSRADVECSAKCASCLT